MDRSKRDLEALVASQKEQLLRYEKRLKDVVTAYKGLLKEKEALETSLNAVTAPHKEISATDDATSYSGKTEKNRNTSIDEFTKVENADGEDEKNDMHGQIMTLMNSLATLSAEKSRMEASFQADKKQLRVQLAQKDQIIGELKEQERMNGVMVKKEVEEMRTKWIIERQEREKETNNQMLMIRELQKLYADERHLKENIEMQLNNFKTQFSNQEQDGKSLQELEQQLKLTKAQLGEVQNADSMTNATSTTNDTSNLLLQQLQQEMQQLKEHHAVALKNEQLRVLLAEEQSRKQVALHEERVANLEARLADLSTSVGKYDRLRYEDQQNILALKQQLKEIDIGSHREHFKDGQQQQQHQHKPLSIAINSNTQDIMSIVEEIVRLKKLLLQENAKTLQPFDMNKIFSVYADHVQCEEEIRRWQQDYDMAKSEVGQLQHELVVKNQHINTLQEKVKVLNVNIDEQELEIKAQQEKEQQAVKEERNRWQLRLVEHENDARSRVNELEQQLQKQRQRSLQLLDEKEQEIKALKNSFEIFQNIHMTTMTTARSSNMSRKSFMENASCTTSSDGESHDESQIPKIKEKHRVQAKKLSLGDNCHMLHYANELARKDIEISGLRKAKYAAETSLHKAIQEKVTAQEELNDKIVQLEEQVDRLERCQTREGANLEYLKNVIISFILTRDVEGKRHMLNAISAVLQFTTDETMAINNSFSK